VTARPSSSTPPEPTPAPTSRLRCATPAAFGLPTHQSIFGSETFSPITWGAFQFWTTSGPYGHAALVTHADPGCDPAKTLVLTNMILDKQYGVSGGAYIVTLAHIEAGFVTPANYLGWSKPLCIGRTIMTSISSREGNRTRSGRSRSRANASTHA
jgi:hypothetical protein